MGIRRYIFLALLMALWRPAAVWAQEATAASQYPVISAYIYNFTQFTTWPPDAIKENFKVCVLGRDPFGSSLAPLRTRSVGGKPIVTKVYGQMSDEVSGCHLLFISDSERNNVGDVVKTMKGKPVLTMSNMDDFVDRGGMVEFEKKDARIGIRIGLHTVEESGISISSKLLRLADTTE
jgi:hypothetical protein